MFGEKAGLESLGEEGRLPARGKGNRGNAPFWAPTKPGQAALDRSRYLPKKLSVVQIRETGRGSKNTFRRVQGGKKGEEWVFWESQTHKKSEIETLMMLAGEGWLGA